MMWGGGFAWNDHVGERWRAKTHRWLQMKAASRTMDMPGEIAVGTPPVNRPQAAHRRAWSSRRVNMPLWRVVVSMLELKRIARAFSVTDLARGWYLS